MAPWYKCEIQPMVADPSPAGGTSTGCQCMTIHPDKSTLYSQILHTHHGKRTLSQVVQRGLNGQAMPLTKRGVA